MKLHKFEYNIEFFKVLLYKLLGNLPDVLLLSINSGSVFQSITVIAKNSESNSS